MGTNVTHGAIAVLTAKSARQILADGGSGSWVLNPRNARRQRYLVCVRNGENHDPDSGERHGAAFLIGVISGLAPLPPQNGQPRWRILIGSYARLAIDDVWKGWRNPVRYTSLEELGIDPESLAFENLAERDGPANEPFPSSQETRPLTIREAKEGLALALGVSPDAVEIIIRG